MIKELRKDLDEAQRKLREKEEEGRKKDEQIHTLTNRQANDEVI